MVDDKGTYALLLALEKGATFTVGRLGIFFFLPGHYIYVGSALGGLLGRIKRHLKSGKKLRWHIDYLLEHARIIEAWYLISEERLECGWQQAVASMPGAQPAVAGFGSSDCRCNSHLIYFSSLPSFEVFRARLGKQGSRVQRQSL